MTLLPPPSLSFKSGIFKVTHHFLEMGNMCCSALNPHASDKPPTIKGQIQKGTTVANGAAGKENENNAVQKAEVGGNKQETKAPKKESLTEKLYATLTNTLYISNNRTLL